MVTISGNESKGERLKATAASETGFPVELDSISVRTVHASLTRTTCENDNYPARPPLRKTKRIHACFAKDSGGRFCLRMPMIGAGATEFANLIMRKKNAALRWVFTFSRFAGKGVLSATSSFNPIEKRGCQA